MNRSSLRNNQLKFKTHVFLEEFMAYTSNEQLKGKPERAPHVTRLDLKTLGH
jgi:hypothetical protein